MRKQGAILLLILMGVSLPWWVGGWPTNMDALQAMYVCLGREDFSTMQGRPAFFRAGAARCLGDLETAHASYMETVGLDSRVTILRAVMPYDIELARQVVSTHTEIAEAHFWLGAALAASLQPGETPLEILEEAIAAYERGLDLNPINGEEWDNLGRLYEATGEWEKAVHAFDLACIYGDSGRNGCLNAGRVYMQHELYEQAAARYLDSLHQIPDYPSSLRGVANALLALGRVEEAIPYLQSLADQGDTGAQSLLEQLEASP